MCADHIFGKYPECIKNTYTLQTKRETQLSIDNGLEETFLQKNIRKGSTSTSKFAQYY